MAAVAVQVGALGKPRLVQVRHWWSGDEGRRQGDEDCRATDRTH